MVYKIKACGLYDRYLGLRELSCEHAISSSLLHPEEARNAPFRVPFEQCSLAIFFSSTASERLCVGPVLRTKFLSPLFQRLVIRMPTLVNRNDKVPEQLIPYIALAKGKSELRIWEMTKHLETNIYITQQFLYVEFEIEQEQIKEEKVVFVVRNG